MGGRVNTHSDDSDDDDDKPVTMRSSSLLKASKVDNYLTVPITKKPFKMEIVDY